MNHFRCRLPRHLNEAGCNRAPLQSIGKIFILYDTSQRHLVVKPL
jgi:hypothetical protein